MMREKANINDIKQSPDNPRFITESKLDLLVKSLQQDPELLFIRPIVVDQDNVIIGGNMRYKAARKLGYQDVWIIRTNFTPEQKEEFIIKDNVNNGEWNYTMIKDLFDTEQVLDWGIDIPTWMDVDTKDLYEDFLLDDDEKQENNSTRVKTNIVFRYEESVTNQVKEKLLEIASTPEQALFNLLKL
jgi:hypothetical protein